MNEWIDAEERVEKAHDLYEKGRLVEAAAELKAAIDINPNNASWHFNLALTLEALEDFTHAAEAYRAALRIEPHDIETITCLGVNLTRMHKYAEALECFERVSLIDPNFEPAWCNRIVTYAEMGDHDQAEIMFYMARQLKSDCPVCYYNIGNSFFARQMYERAIDCWLATLAIDPAYPQANAAIAEACWALGRFEQAKIHYQRELELDDTDVDTLLDLGDLLIEMKQLDEAAKQFAKVIEAVGDHAGAYFGLGEVALTRGNNDQALEHYTRVLKIDGGYTGTHARIARVLLAKGHKPAACRHLLDELANCGDDTCTLAELGELMIEAGLTRQANVVLQRLCRLTPDNPQVHHNLAVSYFMLKQLDKGIAHCRKALKIKPDYALALYNLALAHLQNGRVGRARRYAGKALTLDPENHQIRSLSKRLSDMSGGIIKRLASRS